MIATPSKRISTIFRSFTCYIAVVIITLPGSHLIAREDVPVSMFSIKEKSTQLTEATHDAESRIREFFMDADYQLALFSHFSGNLKQPTMAWLKKAAQLKSHVLDNKFNLSIQLTASSEMDYMMTAFIAKGTNGQPLALLNRNWIEYGITNEALTHLIIEQIGFAFDQFLNAENDSKGNEGKNFANELSSIYEEASAVNAPGYLMLGGRKFLVEN